MSAWLLAVAVALGTGGEPPSPSSDAEAKSIYTQGEWDEMEDAWRKDLWQKLEERERALDELEAAMDELAVQEAYLKWLEWVIGLLEKAK